MFWLLLPTLATAGFFSDHVQKYLNLEIDPCDDFYDHVCSTAMKEERLLSVEGPEQFKNFIHQLADPGISKFRTRLEEDFSKWPTSPMSDSERQAFVRRQRVDFQKCLRENTKFSDDDFLQGAEAYEAHYRMQSTPHYTTLKKKMTNIFTVLKDILIQDFTEAPWTKYHQNLIEFLKNVTLFHWEVEHSIFDSWVGIIEGEYDNCIKISTNLTRDLARKCLTNSACVYKQALGGYILNYTRMAFRFNAHYSPGENKIELSPVFYTLEEDDLPYMLGSLDVVISHEIGHVFFRPGGAIPANSECFREHIKNTCNRYLDKNECSKYDKNFNGGQAVNGDYTRLGDDAADWVGMHGSLKALKNYYPEVFNEKSHNDSNSKRIDILKQFFYGDAINLCNADPTYGDTFHSPEKVRVNGIASMFPEFAEAFQCKRGSKMAKAATCLPFAGDGAPTHKRPHFLQ